MTKGEEILAQRTALFFSGGKDSCFALHRLQQQKIDVVCLMTTVWKDKDETVAHGEKLERINGQAKRLGIPVQFIPVTFETYTEDVVKALSQLKAAYRLRGVAFGDIYLEGHREWGEQVAKDTGLSPYYPLWTDEEGAVRLLKEFVASGFKAEVIRVDESKLPKSWVGRLLDASFIDDIQHKDVCPMGESGEYHTFVYDGPIFRK